MTLKEIRSYYEDIIRKNNLSIDSSLSDESYITYALQLFWYELLDFELLYDDNKTYLEIYKKEHWLRQISTMDDIDQIKALKKDMSLITSRLDKIRFMDAKLVAYENIGALDEALMLSHAILEEAKDSMDLRYLKYGRSLLDKAFTWGYQLNKLDELMAINELQYYVIKKYDLPISGLYLGNHIRILGRQRKFKQLLEVYDEYKDSVDFETFTLDQQLNIYYGKATAEYYLEDYISCLWSFEQAFEISKKQRSTQYGILTLSSLIDVALKANIPVDSSRINTYADKLQYMLNYADNSITTVISAYSKLAILEYLKGNYSDATLFIDKGIECYNTNKDEHHLFYLIINVIKYTKELPGMKNYIHEYLLNHDYGIQSGPLFETYKEILYEASDYFREKNDLKGLDATMKKINSLNYDK